MLCTLLWVTGPLDMCKCNGVLARSARVLRCVSVSGRLDRYCATFCPCGPMDSSDGHSDASDGGGSGRETRKKKEAGASRIKAPKWNCTKSAFSEWCWESEPVWDAKGMHNTYTGANRSEMDSADEKVREAYRDRNGKLFRVIISQLERDSIAAKTLRGMIMDEFGSDRDGYGLLEYLTMWANDLTTAEVKKIKRDSPLSLSERL